MRARIPENTVFDANQFVGQALGELIVHADIKFLALGVVASVGDKPKSAVYSRGVSLMFRAEGISLKSLLKTEESEGTLLGFKFIGAEMLKSAYSKNP